MTRRYIFLDSLTITRSCKFEFPDYNETDLKKNKKKALMTSFSSSNSLIVLSAQICLGECSRPNISKSLKKIKFFNWFKCSRPDSKSFTDPEHWTMINVESEEAGRFWLQFCIVSWILIRRSETDLTFPINVNYTGGASCICIICMYSI